MKFATVMQIGPLQGRTVEILNFFQNQDGGGAMLKKSQKSRYLLNGLTDLYEI